MRFLLVALAFLLCAPAFAQEHVWPTASANQYWHLKAARIEAYRTRDRAYFEGILTDDFVGMNAQGFLNRDQYLAAEFAPAAGVTAPDTEVTNFTATRTGSTLVLAHEEIVRTTVGEALFVERLRRLDVYVRQGGRWRLRSMTAVVAPPAPEVIEISGARRAEYVGVYEFAPGLRSTVRVEGGRLLEQTTGQEGTELLPVGPDVFYAPPDADARVEFERDASGRVVTQIYRSGAQIFRAARVE